MQGLPSILNIPQISAREKKMKLIRSQQANAAPGADAEAVDARHFWKVLVVDDEVDIRTLTRLNLKGFSFDERELQFIEAASSYEARQRLAEHDDIAVALIDVVMETDDAGLRLVEYIRQELGNSLMRLVIRTGQPGAAPERHVIDHYDIDDYKDKTELTATRLYTTVRSAIKAYRDLRTIDMNRLGLARVLAAAPDLYRISNASLNQFFAGVLTQIVGLCHLAEMSLMSTIDGLIATIDGQEITVRAQTGEADARRIADIHQQCVAAVLSGKALENVRHNGIVIALGTPGQPIGFIYIEPTRQLSASDIDLLKVMAQQCSNALENQRLHIDLHRAYDNAIEMLGKVAEFKDKTTGRHIKRIDHYTRRVAVELGIEPEEAILFGMSSRLHDVGKIGIPDEILRKNGRLTPEEFEIMKGHVTIGASILSHDPALALAREIALSHHERWDGKGYPHGRPAGELSLVTRIVSVVDVFDALVSRRPYKEPWQIDEALQAIEAGAGSQFDPTVVAAFVKLFRSGALADLIASVASDNENSAAA